MRTRFDGEAQGFDFAAEVVSVFLQTVTQFS
jgi:hypothetical protein